MKVEDFTRAQIIVSGMATIAKHRAAMAAGKLSSGGARLDGDWLNLPAEKIAPLVREALDNQEAHYRRLAAQIGLQL